MRWWLILAVALWIGLASAQAVEYQPERQTKCWECHKADPNPPTPLRGFWNLGTESTELRNASGGELAMRVQNAWYHEIRYLEALIDLSAAPSLQFLDEREPVDAYATAQAVRPTPNVEPATPPSILPTISGVTDPAVGTITIQVPAGATRLQLDFEELSAEFDPEVEWRIFAGSNNATGGADFDGIYSEDRRATFTRAGVAEFQGFGYGNWTIQAVVSATDQTGAPNLYGTMVPFSVKMQATFDSAGARQALLASYRLLQSGQSNSFNWQLEPVAAPGPGEYISISVNGTVYHEHDPANNAIDWANVTTNLRINVAPQQGGVVLQPEGIDIIPLVASDGASTTEVAEIVGYVSAFTLALSVITGGMFGRHSRRIVNRWMGGARHRVAFHNVLSYGVLGAAIAHTILFLALAFQGGPYNWTLGLIWGGLGILCMIGLGVTGAIQVPIIRRWNYPTWKWIHFWLAILAVFFTCVHLLLDGAHFGAVQDWIGWRDPLDRRAVAG